MSRGIPPASSAALKVEQKMRTQSDAPNSERTHGAARTVLFDAEVAGYIQEHFWRAAEQFGIADDGQLLLTMTVAINPEFEGKVRKWTPS